MKEMSPKDAGSRGAMQLEISMWAWLTPCKERAGRGRGLERFHPASFQVGDLAPGPKPGSLHKVFFSPRI